MSAWTDDTPLPAVQQLTFTQLLALWAANRNGLLGHIAAEEVCRRLTEGKR